MRRRAPEIFPFAIAVVMPPAGLLIGILQMTQDDRDLGVRIVAVSLVAAAIWAFVVLR